MEPKRWVNEHESLEVRLALRAGVAVMPPPGAQRAGWAALGAALASSAATGVAAGTEAGIATVAGAKASVSPSALGAGSLIKLLGVGASAGVLVSGGAALVAHASRTSGPPSSAVVAPRAPALRATPRSSGSAQAEAARPSHPADPLEASPYEANAVGSVSRIAGRGPARDVETPRSRSSDESALVLSAREALRAGDAAEALRILERAKQSAGRGSLEEERLALEIDAKLAAGDGAGAKRLAARFLDRYPASPHAARFRSLP